jgi:hypothetical protein
LSPLHLGLPLFSSEVFVLSPLRFGVASFFIVEFCFEPMIERSNRAPLLMPSRGGTEALVEYQDKLVSYFDREYSGFWRTKLLLLLWGT